MPDSGLREVLQKVQKFFKNVSYKNCAVSSFLLSFHREVMGYLGFSSLGFLLSNIRQVTLRIGSELEGERSKIEKETVVTTIIIRTPSLNIFSYPFSCFLFADAPVLLFL